MSDTSSTTAGGDLIQQARIPVDEAFSLKVREFYEQDEMSMRQIAATLQVPRRWIAQALHDSGVAVSSRGAGRRRRRSRVIQPPMLRETLVRLYVQERLTRAEVATKLDVPESRVRTWLRDLNLPVRSRGGMSREDRKRLPKKPLIALYVKEEMSADRVGERLGSTRRVVLASAHEHGVPVRPGGLSDNTRAVVVLDALYNDPQVVAILHRYAVPIVYHSGAATDRFPQPVRLTAEILMDLYVGCGLSAMQIELVTGQPAATVRRQLLSAGVPPRPAGGLAPFTRRAREASAYRRGRA